MKENRTTNPSQQNTKLACKQVTILLNYDPPTHSQLLNCRTSSPLFSLEDREIVKQVISDLAHFSKSNFFPSSTRAKNVLQLNAGSRYTDKPARLQVAQKSAGHPTSFSY